MNNHYLINCASIGKLEHSINPLDWVVPDGLLMVTYNSHVRLKKIVERFAYYHKREFGYDFVGYTYNDTDAFMTAYLFGGSGYCEPTIFFGACLFRRSEYKELGNPQSLCWIWLHPYFRNQGMLTEAWPKFRERHGDFWVEMPISPTMHSFLRRHNQDSRFYSYWIEKPEESEPCHAD